MTTTAPERATRPQIKPAKPISFDERLALAAVEFDSRSGINPQPVDYADVIRHPVETPTPATPCPYRTPIAGVLHRAKIRLERDGWCRDSLHDEQGAICPIRAIRLEAASRRDADDACVLLLDAIRRDFRNAETIPAWNAQQTSPRPVLLYLDRAAQLAHDRRI